VKNASIPELSLLMKKHNATTNYHTMREAVVADILRVRKEDCKTSKFGRCIDKGDCGTEEMGFLFSCVLCVEMAHATAKSSHRWLMLSGEPPGVNPKSYWLYNPVSSMVQ
jgi:hypothetical protein